jgi:hypothetical protein
MEYNNDFKYDLKLGQEGESFIASLLADTTIEVKTDWIASKTGNVYIEYQSRNKPSGLATTKAKYWIYVILKPNTPRKVFSKDDVQDILFLSTERIKIVCREWLTKNQPKLGGDNNTSLGCLVPIKKFYEQS